MYFLCIHFWEGRWPKDHATVAHGLWLARRGAVGGGGGGLATRCVWLFATLRTAGYQTLLSTGFPRQQYWSGLLFPSPGDLPNPGIEPVALVLTGIFFKTVASEYVEGGRKMF